MRWSAKVAELERLLGAAAATDAEGQVLEPDAAFERWVSRTREVRENGRTVYLIGNGASASMASHFAADLAKNAGLHTQVFTDPALITAISNDLSYEQVFAEPLRRRAGPGDLLVAISSSGRSPNILAGVRTVRELRSGVVTLSAMDASSPLRSLGDVNFWVPAKTYGNAETSHAAILHHWMDALAGE